MESSEKSLKSLKRVMLRRQWRCLIEKMRGMHLGKQ